MSNRLHPTFFLAGLLAVACVTTAAFRAAADDAPGKSNDAPAAPATKPEPLKFPYEIALNPKKAGKETAGPPDWKVVVKEQEVYIHDAAGQPVGRALPKDVIYPTRDWPPYKQPSTSAVSPSGEFVVFGYGFREHKNRKELPTNVGQLVAWHLPTGRRLYLHAGRAGAVTKVAFSEDGKKFHVYAEQFSMDGP